MKGIFNAYPYDHFVRGNFKNITKHTPEPSREKSCLWGIRPGPTQTRLNSNKRSIEACISDLGSRGILLSIYRKQRHLTAQLICVFVFTYAKIRFSHDTAQHIPCLL